MARQRSPFASMTQREQLEKWMEFQSIELPYYEGSVDTAYEEAVIKPVQEALLSKKAQSAREETQNTYAPKEEQSATPPSSLVTSTKPVALREETTQAPHHRQYDAVVQRMRQASQKALVFQRTQ